MGTVEERLAELEAKTQALETTVSDLEDRVEALEEQLEERAEGLYQATNTGRQIDESVTQVRQNGTAWTGKAEKELVIPVVLSKDGWNESTKQQVISDPNLIASDAYRYYFGSLTDSKAAYSDSGVDAKNIVTDGQITFTYEAKPEVDLNVEIHRLEVKHEQP